MLFLRRILICGIVQYHKQIGSRSPHDKENEDYTETFEKQGLSNIFTAKKMKDGEEVSKIITKKGFNCNALYRQCLKMPDILIAANDDFLALHPLGEPGPSIR